MFATRGTRCALEMFYKVTRAMRNELALLHKEHSQATAVHATGTE